MVITGKLSLRDDKEPQIIINRAIPITDLLQAPESAAPVARTLYLKLDGEEDLRYQKVRSIVNMFPGEETVKVFFADTRKMRGARASFDERMLTELKNVLGETNVVLK